MRKSFRFIGIASSCLFLWSEFAVAQETSSETPTDAPGADVTSAPPTAPDAVADDGAATDAPPADSETAAASDDAAGSESASSDASEEAKNSARVVPSEVAYDGDVENRDEPTEEKSKLPELELGTRIMAGFRYRQDEGDVDSRYGFNVRQVRVSMKLKWKKHWSTRTTIDFSDGIGAQGRSVQYLRTAVLEYKHSSAFRVRVGRYKRPFSGMELQSTGDLPLLNRGLTNDLIVEDAAWGDRGIGAMISGKYKPAGIGWTFSLTNPGPNNNTIVVRGIDTIARVTWEPVPDMLEIGVHGGNKYIDFESGKNHFQAGGADVVLRVGGLEWQLEGMMADLPWRNSIGYGALTWVSYTQPISKHLKLQPVVFAEYADSNIDYQKNESMRYQGGINLIVRDRFRIMPQVRVTSAVGEALRSAPPNSPEFFAINPWRNSTQYTLNLSLAL